MPVKKKTVLETITDFVDLDECFRICTNMTVDSQFKEARAKSPASKRNAKTQIRFWGSTAYYLGLVEAMTDDEVLQLEDRIKAKKGGEDAG
jgi:hypothetical protein